jgi:hypothetical protein
MAPASRERNLHVWSSTAPDDRRLKAPWGGARIRPCDVLGVNAELVNLAHNGRLCRESVSGRSEPLKRWRGEDSCSYGHLRGSTQWGESLRASKAPEPPGAIRERVAC